MTNKLNDNRQALLHGRIGKPVGTYSTNDAQTTWLSQMRGRVGDTLQELWTQEFLAVAGATVKVVYDYSDQQHMYLDFLGAAGESLDEKWMDFWDGSTPTAPVGINVAPVELTAGAQGAFKRGYKRDSFGTLTPNVLTTGNEVTLLQVRNNSGRTEFQVEGVYAQDAFLSMEIIGAGGGTLLTADAQYEWLLGDDGLETRWRWNGTANILTDATLYVIDFH